MFFIRSHNSKSKVFLLLLLSIAVIAPYYSYAANMPQGLYIRNGSRYYRIGDKNFTLGQNNQLSDRQAEQILTLVQSWKENNERHDEMRLIWNSLGSVYEGKIFGKILYTIYRAHLNNFIAGLDKGLAKSSDITIKLRAKSKVKTDPDWARSGQTLIYHYMLATAKLYIRGINCKGLLYVNTLETEVNAETEREIACWFSKSTVARKGGRRYYSDRDWKHRTEKATEKATDAVRKKITKKSKYETQNHLVYVTTVLAEKHKDILRSLIDQVPRTDSYRISYHDLLLLELLKTIWKKTERFPSEHRNMLMEKFVKICINACDKPQSQQNIVQYCESIGIKAQIPVKKDKAPF